MVGIILSAIVTAVVIYVYAIFQADMSAAYDRILTGSRIMQTANGTLEYADIGDGNPVLVLHGAGGSSAFVLTRCPYRFFYNRFIFSANWQC